MPIKDILSCHSQSTCIAYNLCIWMQASIGHMGCIGTLLLWCIGTVSKTMEISKSTLQCYVANAKKKGLDDMNFKPNYKSNLVFDEIEEGQLQVYLLTASKHHDGLTTTETRKLAVLSFSFLGSDWFYGTSSMPFCQQQVWAELPVSTRKKVGDFLTIWKTSWFVINLKPSQFITRMSIGLQRNCWNRSEASGTGYVRRMWNTC